MDYTSKYLDETTNILKKIDKPQIEKIKEIILAVRENGGRIFFLGVGGSASNASHAVNDFRKLAGIECYTPTDNVSELTARVNDNGWDTSYSNWLKGCKLNEKDLLFIFSVGGGSIEKNVSMNLVNALQLAQKRNAKIVGIVGRDGGYTAKVADACVIIPTVNPNTVTPHTESFQLLIEHLLISHPDVLRFEMKWESTK